MSRLLSLSLELRTVEAAMKKKTRINDNRTPEKARKTATTMTNTHAPIAKKVPAVRSRCRRRNWQSRRDRAAGAAAETRNGRRLTDAGFTTSRHQWQRRKTLTGSSTRTCTKARYGKRGTRQPVRTSPRSAFTPPRIQRTTRRQASRARQDAQEPPKVIRARTHHHQRRARRAPGGTNRKGPVSIPCRAH